MAIPGRASELRTAQQASAHAFEPEQATPDRKSSVRTHVAGLQGYGVVALIVIVVISAFKAAEGFFVPVVLSMVIALALAPLVRRIGRWIPRWIAAALIVTTLVGVAGATAYSLSDETAQVIAGLPRAARNLRQALRVMIARDQGALSQLQQALRELQRTASESTERPATPSGVTVVQVVEPPVDFSNVVWLTSQGALTALGQLTLVVFLVYFLLANGDLFKRKFVRLSGESLSRRRITVQVIDQISERVARSLSHLVLASTVVGLASWGALWALGVQYAGLWGVAAGLFNMIPYLGPAVIAVGLFVTSLLQFADPRMAVMVAGVSILITTLEGFLFTPIVFGHSVRLNAVAVFISFIFWGWLWGPVGMFLALPLLMVIKTIADSVEDLAPVAEMLSD